MRLIDRPVLHPQVATTVVDEQAVVILADEGDVTVLNPVGTRIWSLIDGTHTVGDIASALVAEYEVPEDDAVRDTSEFIQSLIDAHAVTLNAG